MTVDIPNMFIQMEMPEREEGEEQVIMKITGVLVEMMVQLDPDKYGPCVVFEKGKKVVYVQVLQAIYGMLQAALLWYSKFREDLESKGFKFNPYDPCVANRMMGGKQHTIVFHVDDLKSSHEDKTVNDKFERWLQDKYGEHGKVKVHRGAKHDYLGMVLDYRERRKIVVDMTDYIKDMLGEFPVKFKDKEKVATPAADHLFEAGKGRRLDCNRAETFHTVVTKGLFISK